MGNKRLSEPVLRRICDVIRDWTQPSFCDWLIAGESKLIMGLDLWLLLSKHKKLEQLERLRFEDTPRRLMITHTIESYWIPSRKKTKSKLQL